MIIAAFIPNAAATETRFPSFSTSFYLHLRCLFLAKFPGMTRSRSRLIFGTHLLGGKGHQSIKQRRKLSSERAEDESFPPSFVRLSRALKTLIVAKNCNLDSFCFRMLCFQMRHDSFGVIKSGEKTS